MDIGIIILIAIVAIIALIVIVKMASKPKPVAEPNHERDGISDEMAAALEDVDEGDRQITEISSDGLYLREFWSELIDNLGLDDVAQTPPRIARPTNIRLDLVTDAWISAFFAKSGNTIPPIST